LSLVEIIFLAIALGIDCLVVSFSQGLILKQNRIKNSLYLALTMGLFQGLMPVIGYVGTNGLYRFLVPLSKWIVFGIFLVLGLKFIVEAFEIKKDEIQCLELKCLIGFGIATSIDALVSGATLMLTYTGLLLSCFIIGIVSFLMALVGFFAGNRIKSIKSQYLAVTGGVILIMLAIKSLF